jgi:predicted dehydrogenase
MLRTPIPRRRFLTESAALAAGALGRPSFGSHAFGRSPAASERLRLGVVGCGHRGKYLIGNLPDTVAVAAICDCAKSRLANTLEPRGDFAAVLAGFRERDAARCAVYTDYRQMFARERLDAVIIAAPDHQHVPAALHALAAGLDVYLEKPLTVAIGEGRQLVDAVRKTGRVLQVGSQQRSMEMNRLGCEFIRNGGLGKISHVELPNYPGPLPMSAADVLSEESADEVDWNLFCGSAPLRPHNRRLWIKDEFNVGDLRWRGWDLYRDYSGHLMTNWGAHSVDMVQLALGRDDTGPVEIRVEAPQPSAAILAAWKSKTPPPAGEDEARFRPVTMRYADGVELRFVHGPDYIQFYGEKGRMKMRRNHFEIDPPELLSRRPDPASVSQWSGAGHVARPHLENWLDCIRTRATPNAPVEAGHRTAAVCHLANLARTLGRSLVWDPQRERFVHDEAADALLDRPRRPGFELPAIT